MPKMRDSSMRCFVLLNAMLVAAALAWPARGDEVVLVEKGEAKATVYIAGAAVLEPMSTRDLGALGPEAQEARREAEAMVAAVDDLNHHVRKMSGAALPVVGMAKAGDVKRPAVVLGALAREMGAQLDLDSHNGDQGFRLRVGNGLVLIAGANAEATGHGVYEMLRMLGCDWMLPGEIGEIIPTRGTVALAEMNTWQGPAFQQRRLWYRGYPQPRLAEERERFSTWLRRHKSGSYKHPAAGTGGHVWGGFIRRHQAEFDGDETMYALRRTSDGTMKRSGPQLESTHPRVVELFVEDILAAFEKNGWAKDETVGFGIGPADGLGYSESIESRLAGSGRMDPIVGQEDRTDLLVLLAQQIYEKLGDEYPNVHLGCYSYSTHADYPMRYNPDPRYVQIFAPINFSRFHSLLDPNSKTQAYYREVVEQWGRLHEEQGNILFYRGYNWNLAENMMPYTKVRIWGEELPYYRERGMIGLNVEATKAWSVNGPSDYVFMRLAWDTSLAWRELLAEYCVKSFGDGAEAMERYLLRIVDTQHGAGQEAGSYHAFHLVYDDAFVEAGQRDLAEASRQAKEEAERRRVGHFVHGLEALKLYLAYHASTMDFDFAAAKKGYDGMLAHWQEAYDRNSDLVANETPGYLKRFILMFVEEGLRYSSGDYRMVLKVPDELPTLFDPNVVGHRMRYQSPEINDSRFVRTRTYSMTWDAQGLTGIRSGAVWYRYRFSLADDARGQPIGLFIGGVEDEARVWINGEPVGTSGRGFSKPFVFDLTDGMRVEGENLLAIQVIRNSAANEIGLGGIIRPCFLFAGPRLESKAPKVLELRRALPGGELGEIER